MSYYDYEPNSNDYYYDDYQAYPEVGMSYDDPDCVDYEHVSHQKRFVNANGSYMSRRSYVSARRNSLRNYNCRVSQENLADEVQYTMPPYVAPILYTPSKVLSSSSCKRITAYPSQEYVDRFYYSDSRNPELESGVHPKPKAIQYMYPPDVILEETESSVMTCCESGQCLEREKTDSEGSDSTMATPEKPSRERKRDRRFVHSEANMAPVVSQKRLKYHGQHQGQMGALSNGTLTQTKRKSNSYKRPGEHKIPAGKPSVKKLSGSVSDCGKLEHVTDDQFGLTTTCKGKSPTLPRKYQKDSPKKQCLIDASHSPISCASKAQAKSEEDPPPQQQVKSYLNQPNLKQKESAEKLKPEEPSSESQKVRETPTLDYQSVSDISQYVSPSAKADKTSPKLIGWRNKTISEESTASTSLKSSETSPVAPKASDNSDVTVNTEEYEEFLATIIEKPLEPVTKGSHDTSTTCFMSKLFNKTFKFEKRNKSVDFQYDVENSPVSISVSPTSISATMTPVGNLRKKQFEQEDTTEIEVKTTVSVNKSIAADLRNEKSEDKPAKSPKLESAKDSLCCASTKLQKLNPLLDAPLIMSRKSLFRCDSDDERDLRAVRGKDLVFKSGEPDGKIPTKRSLFMKIIRFFGNFITCVQNISYKYLLRYILFI